MYKEIRSLKLTNAHEALKTAPGTPCQLQVLAQETAAAAAADVVIICIIIILVKKWRTYAVIEKFSIWYFGSCLYRKEMTHRNKLTVKSVTEGIFTKSRTVLKKKPARDGMWAQAYQH